MSSTRRILLVLSALLLLLVPAAAMLNPAAVYCSALGYTYTTDHRADGDYGYCTLPDGTRADAWQFYAGSAGALYGACAQAGYRQEVSSDPVLCPFSAACAVCSMPDGRRAAAAAVLSLSFEETSCGDGTCGTGENAVSCPADCRGGEWDNLCDGILDGRCDPDCGGGRGDPDCGGLTGGPWFLAGLLALALAGAGTYLYLVKKRA